MKNAVKRLSVSLAYKLIYALNEVKRFFFEGTYTVGAKTADRQKQGKSTPLMRVLFKKPEISLKTGFLLEERELFDKAGFSGNQFCKINSAGEL